MPVKAEVCDLTGFSVHADASELMQWVGTATRPPRAVFVVHGEEGPADALRRRLDREFGWPATVPRPAQTFDL